MANISNAINMSFRVDKNLKKQADDLFKKLGMNTSVALNMFLTQCVREKSISKNNFMSISTTTKGFDGVIEVFDLYINSTRKDFKIN